VTRDKASPIGPNGPQWIGRVMGKKSGWEKKNSMARELGGAKGDLFGPT